MGITSAFRTSMLRPANDSRSAPAGNGAPSMSVDNMWFGTPSKSNQKALSCVSTRPLSGMPVGKTQSKALIRSVLTISRRSPRS